MANFQKEWNNKKVYNFSVEFNRIESYNQYVEKWLKEYFGINFGDVSFTHKTNWKETDIVDLNDLNRIRRNLNVLSYVTGDLIDPIPINTQLNQVWTSDKANELEEIVRVNMGGVGDMQFSNHITGLAVSGNTSRIVGE